MSVAEACAEHDDESSLISGNKNILTFEWHMH